MSVAAREETTGTESSVTIKPSYGLSDGDIASMVRASWENAEGDMISRQLAEQQVSAKQLLEHLEAALAADGSTLLSTQEREGLESEMAALEQLLNSATQEKLKIATDALGRSSEVFAARRMDASKKKALTGVSVDSLDEEGDLA